MDTKHLQFDSLLLQGGCASSCARAGYIPACQHI